MGSSRTRAWTRVPCIGRRILNHCATGEVPINWILLSEPQNEVASGGEAEMGAAWEPPHHRPCRGPHPRVHTDFWTTPHQQAAQETGRQCKRRNSGSSAPMFFMLLVSSALNSPNQTNYSHSHWNVSLKQFCHIWWFIPYYFNFVNSCLYSFANVINTFITNCNSQNMVF